MPPRTERGESVQADPVDIRGRSVKLPSGIEVLLARAEGLFDPVPSVRQTLVMDDAVLAYEDHVSKDKRSFRVTLARPDSSTLIVEGSGIRDIENFLVIQADSQGVEVVKRKGPEWSAGKGIKKDGQALKAVKFSRRGIRRLLSAASGALRSADSLLWSTRLQ